jgi:sialic acid synthase SpsE
LAGNLDTSCSYLEIDGKVIGPHKPTYFIAEAGLNHNTDIKLAKKLIEEAHNCGADAIKFQTFKSENFLTPTSIYYDGFKQAELAYDKFGELKDFAKTVGITFFSAPFDIESADFLKKIGVQCFKIASGDFTDLPLIRHVAKMNIPMIISTGVANMDEVEEVVNLCMFESNKKIALLHCIAHYPTDPEEANLLAMDTMRKKFHVPVGYSDNGESLLVDIVAASMGANLIEKHFTIDKKSPGPDHFFSIDPAGLKDLISKIRIVESMHGDGIKAPQISEVEVRQDIRKSITAAEDISENEIITAKKLLTKRPAIGIKPKYFERVVGKKANKKIKKDTAIQWEDIS